MKMMQKNILIVIRINEKTGKESALQYFDNVAKKIIEKNTPALDGQNTFKMSFLTGLLFTNGIVSKEESNELSSKYSDMLLEQMKTQI